MRSMRDMRKYLQLFVVAAGALSAALPAAAEPARAGEITYIVPIKGEIERALVYAIRRGIKEAEESGADVIIFDMDTPGGRIDATMDIVNMIATAKAKTYTYVNPHAFSAGAIIAVGTDAIYMSTNGLIGDAMPILMSPMPGSSPQEVPDKIHEKITSPVAAMIRSAAQRKGHDPKLVEAMVIPPPEDYKIGEKVVATKGHLLTLTAIEATQTVGGTNENQRPLLATAIVNSMDELMEKLGRSNSRRATVEITTAERIARVIDGYPWSGIILAVGMLALYIEFKTPGFGLPGIVGLVFLAIWFWGHHIAGVANIAEIALFVLGLGMIIVEVFFFPTLGVLGVVGAIFLAAAILMGMIQHYPGTPVFPPPMFQFNNAMHNIGVAMGIVLVVGLILAKILPKTAPFQQIMLAAELKPEEGYRSPDSDKNLLGAQGVAVSELRPSGIASFGDKRLDVVTSGEFIRKNTPIVVAEVQGNRVIVQTLENKKG